MTVTYTWVVNSLDCTANTASDPESETDCDDINSVTWTLTGADGNNTSSITSITPLNISMVPEEGEANNSVFLALTEANVVSFIQSAIGSDTVDSLESQISKNLDKLSINIITPPLPWA